MDQIVSTTTRIQFQLKCYALRLGTNYTYNTMYENEEWFISSKECALIYRKIDISFFLFRHSLNQFKTLPHFLNASLNLHTPHRNHYGMITLASFIAFYFPRLSCLFSFKICLHLLLFISITLCSRIWSCKSNQSELPLTFITLFEVSWPLIRC